MNDLVSVITPSYNTAEFISETIESVLSQTYDNWEMIIVDDCSTDNTDDVVSEYSARDPRIRYIKNDTNLGAALTRNRALDEARGQWIAFLDSDDLWEPDKLEQQINFMKNGNINFSYTGYCEIDENSNEMGICVTGPKRITKIGMYNYCWIGCLTVMYNAKEVGLIQIADIKKNNDYALWLKVIKKADCHLLDLNLAKYRKRTGSISHHSSLTLIKWHYRLFRISEQQNPLLAGLNTLRNLIFGVFKKIIFTKRY